MSKNDRSLKIRVSSNYLSEISFGINSFSLTAIFILLIQLIRGDNFTETFDKAIFGIAILISFSFLLIGSISKNSKRASVGSLLIFLIAFLLGVGGIEKHQPINGVVLSNRLWLGFGPYVLAISILLSPFVFRLIQWKDLSRPIKALMSTLFVANLLLVVPSFWQNSASVIDPDHSEYVINELVGPLNGNWPYADYIPQYQTFYGFLLKPLLMNSNAVDASNLILIFLTVLTYLTIAIGVYISWLGLNKRSWILAIGITVPFMGLTQFPNREGYLGSIAALLSGLSIRIFPGILLFVIALYVRSKSLKRNWYLLVGFVGGIVAWQSQDFGIAAVVALGFVLLIAHGIGKLESFKVASIYSVGLILGLSVYPLIGKIFGHTIDLSKFLFFARQFGSGFGAEGMRTPGPVLYILPLIVMLFVIHGATLIKNRNDETLAKISFIGFFMATWSLLGFSYYLNRSYASGQMQVLFLPIAISVASLAGVINHLSESGKVFTGNYKDMFFSASYWREKRTSTLVPIAAIFSLAFATLLLSPNPAIETKRIKEGAESPRWPKESVVASVKDVEAAKIYANKNKLSLAFFGASSQYVELETGVESVSILNSPFDLVMSQQTVTTSCEYIFSLNPDAIVVSDEGQQLFRFENQTLCNKYKFADAPGVRQYHYAVRI